MMSKLEDGNFNLVIWIGVLEIILGFCIIGRKAFQYIKPIIDYITQGLIIPCTSACNIFILPVRKPKG